MRKGSSVPREFSWSENYKLFLQSIFRRLLLSTARILLKPNKVTIKRCSMKYRKIPLVRSGRIYQHKANLMRPYSGRVAVEGGSLIFGRKNTSVCNLSNVLTFFLFFQYKARILTYFTSCKILNMFKVNHEDTRIRKVNNKVNKEDTVNVFLVSLLITSNTFHFL